MAAMEEVAVEVHSDAVRGGEPEKKNMLWVKKQPFIHS